MMKFHWAHRTENDRHPEACGSEINANKTQKCGDLDKVHRKKIKNLKAHILISLIELLNYTTVWGKHKDADARVECSSLNSSKAAYLITKWIRKLLNILKNNQKHLESEGEETRGAASMRAVTQYSNHFTQLLFSGIHTSLKQLIKL